MARFLSVCAFFATWLAAAAAYAAVGEEFGPLAELLIGGSALAALTAIAIALAAGRTARQAMAERDTLKAALDSMGQGVVAFDEDLRLVAWNPRFLEIRGYPLEMAVRGAPFADFMRFDATRDEFGPGDPERVVQNQVSQARQFLPHRFERRRPNGRFLEVQGGPIPGGGFVSTFSDITERKKAEALLAEKEAQLRLALDQMLDGIYMIDRDGRYIVFNDRYRDLLDVPDDLIRVGGPVEDVVRFLAQRGDYGPVDPGIFVEKRMEMFRSREPHEIELNSPIGTLEFRQSPTAGGGTVVVCHDATERRRFETELARVRDQALKANRAKSEFLSSMSHELRTPPNAILGFAQLLEMSRKEPLSDKQKEYVERIMAGGRHLLELINEVLDLAKIEAGKIDLAIEDLVTRTFLDDCLSLVHSMAEKRRITLVDRSARVLPALRADVTRARQVLLNLLSNAVKYNHEGGSVFLDCEVSETGLLRLSVTDTGPGIPKQRQGEIFQPFNRLGAEATEIEGTGIGLTITRRLMEQMEGAIGFSSEPGRGSTFWLEFPLAALSAAVADAAGRPPRAAPSDDAAALAAVETSRTVLYVEDNPANLRLMEELVAEIPDFRMIAARTAETGVALAVEHRPDVVLMDINLPGMDGMAALQRLRELDATRHIPVIALSANAMPETIRRGIDSGFHRYLTKPVDVGELLIALREVAGEGTA